jgi:hypothetical protein
MVKRIGLSVALLAGLVAFAAPRQANAETHFGVYIGTAPRVYTAPAPVYGYDPYAAPYVDPYYDNYAAPVYSYPAPVYVAPSYGYGYYGHGWRDHDRHEMREHERHEMREHNRGWRR